MANSGLAAEIANKKAELTASLNAIQDGAATSAATSLEAVLAKSSWRASADNSLIVTDVYGADAKAKLNSITAVLGGFDITKVLSVRGGMDMFNKVKSTLSTVKSLKTALTTGSIEDRLRATLGSSKSILGTLGADTKGTLFKSLEGAGNYVTTINGVASKVKNLDFGNISSLGQTLNALTGQSKLFGLEDITAKLGVSSTLVSEFSKNGIPGAFGQVKNLFTNNADVKKLIGQCLPGCLNNADLGLLKELGGSALEKELLKLEPALFDKISKNFKSGSSDDSGYSDGGDAVMSFKEVVSSFNAVDPRWSTPPDPTDPAGTDTAVDIQLVLYGNPEFQKVITTGATMSTDESHKYLALGTLFSPTTVEDELKTQFPQTVLASNQTTLNTTVSPLSFGY